MTAKAENREVIDRTLSRALSGKDAHVETAGVLEDLEWKIAGERPDGVAHSIFQIANHIVYWQEWAVKWLDGKKPRAPKHAAGSWPGKVSPANRREWDRTIRRLRDSLAALESHSGQADLWAKRGKWTPMEMLQVIGSHSSYHAGQIVLLRQQLGAWPPPSGGATW